MSKSAALVDSSLAVSVTPRAAMRVARGGLWIFSNETRLPKPYPPPGTWCRFESRGHPVGLGYFNPHSLIAGRIVSPEMSGEPRQILRQRLTDAFRNRIALLQQGSARLVFSEGDFIPGLIIDGYGGTVVLQSNTAGVDSVLEILESLVPEVFERVFQRKPEAFVVRAESSVRRLEGIENFSKIIFGDKEKIAEGTLREGGVTYAANFLEGQKTGFFLDQRDNRAALRKLCGSSVKKVLDLFCYSGGWGFAALKGGAGHVTFVDESKEAIALVTRGLALNGISAAQALRVNAEVGKFLESDQGSYDIVVLDPPAYVKSAKHLPQALSAYEKLNRLAWRRLSPGGVLFSSSCSYHLGEPEFLTLLRTAVANEKGLARVIHRGGQPLDHPVLLAMPETRYLKCIGLKKV